jgi:Zinc knuckle
LEVPRNSMSVCTANDGVTFAQVDNAEQGKVKKNKDHIKCWTCGKMGHYAPECPNKDSEGEGNNVSGQQHLINAVCNGDCDDDARLTSFQFTVTGVQLQGSDGVQIPPSWILLDNQSKIDVFSNKLLLSKCGYIK